MTISNTGNIPLQVSKITYPTGFTGDWSGGAILAQSSQEVDITFKPTETKDYKGRVEVFSNAEGKNTLEITGKGILVTSITAKGGTSEPWQALPGFKVFPNPAGDVLQIKFPNPSSPVALQLTDVKGQIVYERKAVTTDELSIDVSGYESGVYMLVVESGGKVAKRKVVVSSQ